ncbi:MAG TPA: hypothetical protein VGK82_12790 [Pyrinomonadaceae bacterium]
MQCFDRHLAARIERLFGGWQLTPVASCDLNPDIEISFSSADSLPVIPRGLSEFEVAAGGRCYVDTDELYLQFNNSLLLLEHKNPVCVSVFIREVNDVELGRVTSFAVCAAMRRFGLFELHAAGVVVPNTRDGVLIVGPSGSGKSTLTLELVKSGWGYLSDDELLLNVAGEEVEARGFRSFFALSPASGATVGPSRFKTSFEPASIFAVPAVSCVAPRSVLFTSISGLNETQISALDQSETMTRLIRACPWATYDTAVAGPYLQLLSRLAHQARGFDLQAGTDLLEPDRASHIILRCVSRVNNGD